MASLPIVSAAAEAAIWHCMVDNPQLFFSPMLAQFNTLYQTIKEQRNSNLEQNVVRESGRERGRE